MTQQDVDIARKTLLQSRQAAYELQYAAIKNSVAADRKLAKQQLADLQDQEDALNQIVGLIILIASMS